MTRLEKWQAELDRIKINYRWGETRRFHSDARKIDRRNWLIEHISREAEKERHIERAKQQA